GTISGTSITGLGMGPDAAINYIGSQLSSLTVRGAIANNTVAVLGTSTATTLHTGAGSSMVNVRAASSPLTIDADNAAPTVTVGSQAPNLNGTLVNIAAPVTVANSSGTLNVDDSGDKKARTANLSATAVSGLGMGSGGSILYNGSS